MEAYRLADLPRRQARERAGAPALTGGGRTFTYADLDERSSRVAQGLLASDVGKGSRVAHLDKNAPEFFDLLFGTAKIGAVVAPVNWRLTPREIAGVVRDAGAELLVVGGELAEAADEFTPSLDRGCQVLFTGEQYESWLTAHPADDPGYVGGDDDVVLQLYTSGTTGRPKGVQLVNGNLGALGDVAPEWGIEDSSVSLVAMPLFHIGGSGWALVGLSNGACNVLVRDIDPVSLLDTMERERVTHGFLVPAVLQTLVAVPGADQRDLSSLRSVVYGASPITSEVLRAALGTLRCPLFQVYGLTETTGAITQLDAADHDPDGPYAHRMRSAGKPYPWVEMKVVDPATGEDLALGQVGEVWTRSAQNMTGYWRQHDETRATVQSGGWLRTGDAGYIDEDGYVFLTDRIKDMILSGAENVYPIEVEEVLAGHPDIADVAVIGVPDERLGEAVKAVVVPRPGSALTEEDVTAYARGRLAGFKRPRSVDFLAALPRNPTGKVLKRQLRAPYWAGRERAIG